MKSLAGTLLLVSLVPVFSSARRAARSGTKEYARGRYANAEKLFAAAAQKDPADPAWKYDLGTARAGGKERDAARQALSQAVTAKDPAVAAAALYQLGTLDLNAGNYHGALDNLRKSLELNPFRKDAKTNFEIALRNLKSPPPHPQPRPKSGAGKSPPPPSAPASPPKGTGNSEKPDPFEQKAGMSRAQADAILRSLDAEQQRKEKVRGNPAEKDW